MGRRHQTAVVAGAETAAEAAAGAAASAIDGRQQTAVVAGAETAAGATAAAPTGAAAGTGVARAIVIDVGGAEVEQSKDVLRIAEVDVQIARDAEVLERH